MKVTIDREQLADLLSNDREKRINAERTLYSILANPNQQGEAVEVVGWLGGNGLHTERHDATGAPFPLMTVAQHERILAALADNSGNPNLPAGCKVVPVGLLERLAGNSCDPDCCIAYWRAELRALLASAEGVRP